MDGEMTQSLGLVTLVVEDYDEAIAFYVRTLGFRLVEDSFIEAQNKRWVVVAPPGSSASPDSAGSAGSAGAGLLLGPSQWSRPGIARRQPDRRSSVSVSLH